jgi:hypothetical protein
MDFINEWTLTVCVTLIISVIFSMLAPKGNMGNFYKVILSTLIFLSFIYPLKSAQIDLSFPEFSIDDYEIEQSDTYESMINTEVEQTLDVGGYKSCVVNSDVELVDNEISINNVSVSILSEYNDDEVKNYLFDNLGINAEVYYLGE